MSALKAGDKFPDSISFSYVPYTPEKGEVTACGTPQKFDASKEFANKKVVVVSVPGAFTPTCQADHVTGYIANKDKLKAAGVDQVVFIAFNDAWVMSAWGKANNIKDDFIVFASDEGAAFSKSIGWTAGERTARYAVVIDHGKVTYSEKEPDRGVTVSGAEAVLAKLQGDGICVFLNGQEPCVENGIDKCSGLALEEFNNYRDFFLSPENQEQHYKFAATDTDGMDSRIDFEKLLDEEGWDLDDEVESPHRPVGQTPGVSC